MSPVIVVVVVKSRVDKYLKPVKLSCIMGALHATLSLSSDSIGIKVTTTIQHHTAEPGEMEGFYQSARQSDPQICPNKMITLSKKYMSH